MKVSNGFFHGRFHGIIFVNGFRFVKFSPGWEVKIVVADVWSCEKIATDVFNTPNNWNKQFSGCLWTCEDPIESIGTSNGGKWQGKQILSTEWTKKSGAPLRNLSAIQEYGYLWNSVEYPYKDRKVRAYFAAGNGGQIFMGIPDLDLVIAFTGGSYADPALFIPQRVYVPEYILSAVNWSLLIRASTRAARA